VTRQRIFIAENEGLPVWIDLDLAWSGPDLGLKKRLVRWSIFPGFGWSSRSGSFAGMTEKSHKWTVTWDKTGQARTHTVRLYCDVNDNQWCDGSLPVNPAPNPTPLPVFDGDEIDASRAIDVIVIKANLGVENLPEDLEETPGALLRIGQTTGLTLIEALPAPLEPGASLVLATNPEQCPSLSLIYDGQAASLPHTWTVNANHEALDSQGRGLTGWSVNGASMTDATGEWLELHYCCGPYAVASDKVLFRVAPYDYWVATPTPTPTPDPAGLAVWFNNAEGPQDATDKDVYFSYQNGTYTFGPEGFYAKQSDFHDFDRLCRFNVSPAVWRYEKELWEDHSWPQKGVFQPFPVEGPIATDAPLKWQDDTSFPAASPPAVLASVPTPPDDGEHTRKANAAIIDAGILTVPELPVAPPYKLLTNGSSALMVADIRPVLGRTEGQEFVWTRSGNLRWVDDEGAELAPNPTVFPDHCAGRVNVKAVAIGPASVRLDYTSPFDDLDRRVSSDATIEFLVKDPEVIGVWWEALAANLPLDSNPNAGGGLRIFPDKKYESDTANGRQYVYIKARVFPPKAGVLVHFRVFDIDDPSSLIGPIDSNDEEYMWGVRGDDNHGALESLQSPVCTGDNGIATAQFQVSYNPGDNYKAMAHTDQSVINNMTLHEIDNGTPDPQYLTEMLTVWRKAWIEADSYAAPSATGSYQSTNFRTVSISNMVATVYPTRWEVYFASDPATGDAEFSNGILYIPGYEITAQVDNNSKSSGKYTVAGALSTQHIGQTAQLYDDDWESISSMRISFPVTLQFGTRLESVYRDAYVKPVIVESSFHDSYPFKASDNNSEISQRDLMRFTNFWLFYFVLKNQMYENGDHDPDQLQHLVIGESELGVARGQLPLEVIRDSIGSMQELTQDDVLAHEMGHQFGLDHDSSTNPYYLMHQEPDYFKGRPLNPADIHHIRSHSSIAAE